MRNGEVLSLSTGLRDEAMVDGELLRQAVTDVLREG